MKYLSVCSGIEAATQAWHPLGWSPVAFSEIEPFPCKVLAHHYPQVPNLGDMTKFKEWPDYANVDVLVGGTPCQSFSIAGLRKGLDDPRGNLMLTYLAIAAKYLPKWVVWENVPGVLSSNGGKDFGTFLAGLGECGYGFAYRVLDAQYVRTDGYPYAVPQRRRRLFVVGHLGSWQRAASVLFDSESLRGNPPPSREAGQEVTGTVSARAGCSIGAQDAALGHLRPCVTTNRMVAFGEYVSDGTASTMKMRDYKDATDLVTYALAGNTIVREPQNGGNGTGYDESGVSYTLTKTDVHAVAYPIDTQNMTAGHSSGGRGYSEDGEPSFTLSKGHHHAVAFKIRGGCEGGGKGYLGSDKTAFTLGTHQDQNIFNGMQVRRLTPEECERLQGFPDNFTKIPGSSDTARYKSLGNSMAVNVMQVLGERIQMASSIPLYKEIAA